MLPDLLDDYWERAAENCALFVNISEVDKYCITCTICRHFESDGCMNLEAPSLLNLLKSSYEHDSQS
jgi:hypothetical protein